MKDTDMKTWETAFSNKKEEGEKAAVLCSSPQFTGESG